MSLLREAVYLRCRCFFLAFFDSAAGAAACASGLRATKNTHLYTRCIIDVAISVYVDETDFSFCNSKTTPPHEHAWHKAEQQQQHASAITIGMPVVRGIQTRTHTRSHRHTSIVKPYDRITCLSCW
jgi:hypothetical protein